MIAKAMLGMTLALTGLSGTAASLASGTGVKVIIQIHCQGNIPAVPLHLALPTASRLFSEIGVQVEWLTHRPTSDFGDSESIQIEIDEQAPPTYRTPHLADALASALPYAHGGTRIKVFYDRIQPLVDQYWERASTLFGYVLAHEIAHVLEGVSRHSMTGVMRAEWSPSDISAMLCGRVHFAEEDSELILENLRHRNTLTAAQLSQIRSERATHR